MDPKEKKELTEEEKEYKSKRKQIQEKLIKFATRIPAFMYLTDFRENTLQDVITKLEPDLFKTVTGLTVEDFNLLVSLGVFNATHMNQAVFAFRRYEDAVPVDTPASRDRPRSSTDARGSAPATASTTRSSRKGRVSRAITHRLGAMESIESRGGRGTGALWMIQGGDPNGVAPPLEDLIASSFRLTGIIAARTVAEPQPGKPLIDPTSLEAVLNDALTLASCPLDHTMLLDIVVARFPAVVEDRELSLTDRNLVAVPSEHQDRTVINDAADEVWAQLNHRERLALPAVGGDRTVRDLADELGMSKSTVGRAKEAAEAVLAAALPAPDDSAAVAAELLRRSAALADGTEPAPSPSSSDAGGEP
jgi:hypothetical protein